MQQTRIGAQRIYGLVQGRRTLPLMDEFGTGSAKICQSGRVLQRRKGTKWSDLRRSHGVAEPYKIKNWCLGNEMDVLGRSAT